MFRSSFIVAIAASLHLPWSTMAEPKVLDMRFDISKVVSQSATISRRSNGVSVGLQNLKKLYTVNITVGTPPQKFRVNVDTGSSDLFVVSKNSDLCKAHRADCKVNGQYDEQASSSAHIMDDLFDASYADGSGYRGTYIRDTVRLNKASMDSVQFGLATHTEDIVALEPGADTVGLMGLGLEANEFSIDNGGSQYPNILSQLKKHGHIKTKSFSLYLNSLDAPSGTILFGGVDKSKYKGPLIAAPMVPPPGEKELTEYAIECTSFNVSSPNGTTSLMPSNATNVVYALLDSGSTNSYIPPYLIPWLYSYLGAKTDPNLSNAAVPCNLSTADSTFTFGFGGPKGPQITVPISDFIAPRSDHLNLTFADGTPACELAIGANEDTTMTLGDSFLRSAYAVYDVERKIIALAQSNLSPKGDSDIVEITPVANGIPGVKAVVKTISFDEKELESQSSAIEASASAAATQETQSNFSFGTLTELPGSASVTAQGASTSSTGSATVDGTKSTASKSQASTLTPTNAGVSLSGSGALAITTVLLGILCFL